MAKPILEMAQRGQITLPKELRDQYHLEPGTKFSLIDLDGVFVLSPQESRIDDLCDRFRDAILSEGTSLEEMLTTLREMREGDAP